MVIGSAFPPGRQARFVQGAGVQANDVGYVALRLQAFWRNIRIGGIKQVDHGRFPMEDD
jgi:hypothetical protein